MAIYRREQRFAVSGSANYGEGRGKSRRRERQIAAKGEANRGEGKGETAVNRAENYNEESYEL